MIRQAVRTGSRAARRFSVQVHAAAAPQRHKYVVLGGGNASGYAAREFVARSINAGELLIITAEPAVAYERPTLSKGYLFPEGAPRLPGFHTCVGGGGDRQPPEWYQDNGIEYKINTTITSVDFDGRTLRSADGQQFGYDTLVLATGCRAASMVDFGVEGADADGIHTLRNVADADALLQSIAHTKAHSNQAVVVGGSYIGMECTSGLVKNGVQVTMVFPEDHFMQRLFTPRIAAFYEDYYRQHGVELVNNDTVVGFEKDANGRVSKARCKSGRELACDMVVVGVGARPNVEMFKDHLKMENGGVKVDGKLQTSERGVYAIGDIASFPLAMAGGKPVRQEHVAHCRQSAQHVVNAIMSPDSTADYDYMPYFYSRVLDLGWQFYGMNNGQDVFFGSPSEKKFGTYWVEGGKVVGAFLEGGSADENAAIKRVAGQQRAAPFSITDLELQGLQFAMSDK